MEVWQFRQLVEELGDARVRQFLDVSPATLRRWKTNQVRIPKSATIALRLHYDGDLSAIGGDDWAGFRFKDGLLCLPGWRNGWKPGAIRAMFFEVQLVASLKADVQALKARIEDLERDLAAETSRAEKYRALVRADCRLGLAMGKLD